MTQKYEEASLHLKETEHELERAKESMLALQNDNNFMKKLIYYAN